VPTTTEEPEPSPTPEPYPTPDLTPSPSPTTEDGEDDEILDGDDFTREDDSSSDEELGRSEDPFGTIPSVQIEEFHDEALSELLLNVEQMPEDWSVMVEGSLPDDAEATQSLGDMLSGPWGNEQLTPEAMGHPVQVGRQFIEQDLGPFFNQDLFEFENEERAMEAMELALAQLDCEDWAAEDPATGMDVQYTLEDLDFPDLGDQSAAVSLSIRMTSNGQAGAQAVQQPAQFDDLFGNPSSEMVVVRQGNRFSSFTFLDWFGNNDLNLEEVVTIAVEQIEKENAR
jgi:hypothetical protein